MNQTNVLTTNYLNFIQHWRTGSPRPYGIKVAPNRLDCLFHSWFLEEKRERKIRNQSLSSTESHSSKFLQQIEAHNIFLDHWFFGFDFLHCRRPDDCNPKKIQKDHSPVSHSHFFHKQRRNIRSQPTCLLRRNRCTAIGLPESLTCP